MDSRKIVYRETGVVALGEIICLALTFAVFAMLGYFDKTVVLGGVVGTLLALGNFFMMAVSATLAADKAEKQDVKGGTRLMKSSYLLRLGVIFLILFACVKSGQCHVLASVIPLLLVRPIITVAEFFRKPREETV